MEIPGVSTNLWTVLTVIEPSILVPDRFFRTYLTHSFDNLIDCYVGEALCHRYTDILKIPHEMFEG